MDKSSINVFEVKVAIKEIPFKISAGDVFNQFLYLGDEKGTMYAYPIRAGDSQVIPKNIQQNAKSITKSKIDKILSYRPLSLLIVLSDQKLFVVDPSMKKIEPIAQKVHSLQQNRFMTSPQINLSQNKVDYTALLQYQEKSKV